MVAIRHKHKNNYLVNDKLVKVIGNKIVFLDNLNNEEKQSFREYINSSTRK